MRITSWNVNGLRAALKKDAAKWWLAEKPDVLCLQEVRARPDQLSSSQLALFDEVDAVWNPAERGGYSGVATFSHVVPLSTRLGLGEERFDIEGRVIETQFTDFVLFNIYFPNGGRDHSRVAYKLDFYASLLDLCDKLHEEGKQIIICGDFNTAHQEIDLKNHRQNKNSTGFLLEERAWIDKYLERGFVDAYRTLYPEREQYTWWANWGNARQNNVGWRLDYFLLSESLMLEVVDVVIHDDVLGSDHCPVTLELNI